VMPGHGVASGFDLISAIRSSKMRKKVATIVQHRSAASTVQRSITVAEVALRAASADVATILKRKCGR